MMCKKETNRLQRSLLALALMSAFAAVPAMADECTLKSGDTTAAGAGTDALACGKNSTASGGASVADGDLSVASGDGSTAVGGAFDRNKDGAITDTEQTVASGLFGTAIGSGSHATATKATALGWLAAASGTNGTALGANSTATATDSTAIGAFAQATGVGSTAVGRGATASAANSVALGTGSVATRDNTVSVGSAGAERQITNVADATQGTDAVNLRQVNARFAQFSLDLGGFEAAVNGRFEIQDERISRNGAMSSAMAQMTASAAGIRATNRIAVGVGFENGQNALAVGFQRSLSDSSALTFGAAISGGESSAGVGLGYGW
jgi:autotransporter adhesin